MENTDTEQNNEKDSNSELLSSINKFNRISFVDYIPEGTNLNLLDYNYSFWWSNFFFFIYRLLKKFPSTIKKIDKVINFLEKLFLFLSHECNNTDLNIIEEIYKFNTDDIFKYDVLDKYENLVGPHKKNYLEEIFKLLEKISNYDQYNIIEKYEISRFISEYDELKKTVENFNKEIDISNTNIYFFTLYYNFIISLMIKKLKWENDPRNSGYTNFNDDYKKVRDIFIEQQKKELEKKIELFLKNVEILIGVKLDGCINKEKFENIGNMLTKELNKELLCCQKNKKTTSKKAEELKNLDKELTKLSDCYNEINSFITTFYDEYLVRLKKFLSSTKNILTYLKKLDYNSELNLRIITDFIFSISYFDFYEMKYIEMAKYYENNSINSELNIINSVKIVNGNLISVDGRVLENYKHYNLEINEGLIILYKNKFKHENILKYDIFPKENMLNKNMKVIENFFLDVLTNNNSVLKELLIDTFPILDKNYFINEDFIHYIFNKKIFGYNITTKEFVGLTTYNNLNIYIKDYYGEQNDDNAENEICIYAAFILIIIHELAHFIRMYIFKHLHLEVYERSFEYRDNIREIGYFIETMLFGIEIHTLNIEEALYILNEENYVKKTKDSFKEGYLKAKSNRNGGLVVDNKIKDTLSKFNITTPNSSELSIKSELKVKGNKNSFYIGRNNDKCCDLMEMRIISKCIQNLKQKLITKK